MQYKILIKKNKPYARSFFLFLLHTVSSASHVYHNLFADVDSIPAVRFIIINIASLFSHMYFRLLTRLCERPLYRTSSNVRPQISRLCRAANKNEEKREVEINSTRFPGYKVIYTFPYAKHASAINIVKHRITIFTLAAVPVIVGLCLTDIVSLDTAVSAITSGVITTIWLHTLGILCNNLIGYIYMKLDKQKVILSYIDYWGKRKDTEIAIDQIIPMSDNPISITDSLYRKVMFASQERKLKINMKLGRIIDTENFTCILGTI